MIPSLLSEDGEDAIPAYIINAISQCQVFFVENERTARRYLKKIWKEIVIDDYEWHVIAEKEKKVDTVFIHRIKEGKTIGIISEAGCPGIADPGQSLVRIAQEMQAEVKPLVGPSSILLALMGSGMNGQQFRFSGYLPINEQERVKAIKELESESQKKNCTQIFIETPYRNNQLLDTILRTCKPDTRICIAVNLTGNNESIRTKTVDQWKKQRPELHKVVGIFCLYAGN